ncbi:MAG: NUDIX domain-containing protein [Candidatus Desulfofervidaceae bacterium]|nr:NUDIX domain-containing protein [Candidatus Desulfofervidaceae bacterium]MDL1969802.1 NUDIX domain-containing protein [Candidatus Desulfofervidaceae bacterium]
MEEYLEIVDATDKVIGLGKRSFIHEVGCLHRAVHIFVFNLEGKLFLQKRAPNKDQHPDKWTSSASGHVDPKETYEKAAYRELKEELALEVPLKKVFKVNACKETDGEHVVLYEAQTDFLPFPNRAEISEAKFYTLEEIQNMIEENQEAFTPSFIYLFKLYQERDS